MDKNIINKSLEALVFRIRQIDKLAMDVKNDDLDNWRKAQVQCDYAMEEIERIQESLNKE